ncbi:MAG: biotin synthase BioB [Lachnospiraceae bacterium]|nr:biotin synthase BioB [Lachnospiraceae bacterium]
MITLADEIINGHRLKRTDDLTFLLKADLGQLCQGANNIRKALCGNYVDLCSIINGRAGRCSENCKFCAQSSHYQTTCSEYGFLDKDSILNDCEHVSSQGVNRYSIVTAGRTLEGEDLEKAVEAYQAMHEAYPDMILCASHGLMKSEDLKRLHNAGVTMYHANIETSQNFFPNICTTHKFEDKLMEIQLAKEAGLEICCGGILGLGESWEDRLDMAAQLAKLQVASIPLNFLIPIAGTPLEKNKPLEPAEIIRIVAIFRYLNPTAYIRIAAGRNYFDDGGEILFRSGANAALTGDMLTTVGNSTAQDRDMFAKLGFSFKEKRAD